MGRSADASAPTGDEGTDTPTVLVATGGETQQPSAARSRPDLVAAMRRGRYLVIEAIGSGGMGTVWRAYDPKLHREVALKQLRRDSLDREAERRLVREAQAMAQLSHPNVVAVFDVEVESEGEAQTGVLIAMEYVPGQTLRDWLADATRTWTEIVATFRDAGEGLAAAHRAGLVHRDFKPTNVLVTTEGQRRQVKVTDFGLAKGVEVAESMGDGTTTTGGGRASMSRSSDSLDELASPLTEADVVMGTPRYMAPEQHAGASAGPGADQYAFCVALWEALCGKAPFSGRKLARAKFKGPPAWPRSVHVPRKITDAIRRGLSVDPDARWPAMADLLAELAHDPARRRRIATRFAVAGLVLGSAGIAVAGWATRRAAVCTGADALMAEVWDDARYAEVQAAFSATELPYAADAFTAIAPRLDAYASTWVAQHREACEATSVRREQSAEALDLRMACLHRARTDLEATAELLIAADATVVEKSLDLVDGLPSLERCADPTRLRAGGAEPDPAIADAVQGARAELSRARALERTGQYDEALAILDDLRPEVEGLGHPPLMVELELLAGNVLEGLGRYEDSEPRLEAALKRALEGSMTRMAASAATELTHVVGYRDARHAEGRWLGAMATSLASSVDPGGLLEASAREAVAATLQGDGKYAEARAIMEQTHALRRERQGEDSIGYATSLHRLGINAASQGDYDEAEAYLREAVKRRKALLGDDHPSVGYALNALADVLRLKGDLDAALARAQESLAVRDRSLAPDHPSRGATLNNIGIIYYMKGDFEKAADYNRQARDVRAKAHGENHPDVADSDNNIGVCLNALGRYPEAEVHHRRALEIRREVLGDDHPAIAMSLTNLAVAVRHQGKLAEAERYAREALELNIARLGADHSEVANSHDNLGSALLEQGKHEAALEQYVKARDVRAKALGPEHAEVARALSNMGSALNDLERFDEAAEHLEHAIEIWTRELGPEYADLGFAWQGLGDARWGLGRLDEAEAAFRSALKVRESALDDDHPLIAVPLTRLGQLAIERGRPRDAIAMLERARKIRIDADEPAELRVESTFALAQARWAAGRDRAGARELATQARDEAEGEARVEIDAWLAERG